MRSVYKSAAGREVIRRWCRDRLAAWSVPYDSGLVDTSGGPVHVLRAGAGSRTVVFVPGTTLNAAACLDWIEALAAEHRVLAVDLPGQPGLSADTRPGSGRVDWYGRLLSEVLAGEPDGVIVLGNSLGAAVALACDSSRIAGRVLVSPGGIIRLAVSPLLLWRSTNWLLRPGTGNTRRMLELFVAPGQQPPEIEVEWMTLVARHCRSTLAPPPLAAELLRDRARTPCRVSTGQYDRFLSPARPPRPGRRRETGNPAARPGWAGPSDHSRPARRGGRPRVRTDPRPAGPGSLNRCRPHLAVAPQR
ncbi:MAG: alpha/beta fold hydrolase [Stackebrandtia sp.]